MDVYNFFELAHKELLPGFKEECNVLSPIFQEKGSWSFFC